MTYIQSYLSGISNPGLKDSILSTSEAVFNNVKKHFNFTSPATGLLLGNVQSGKTGQMLGIMSRLADEGYRLFLLLTTDNVDLQRQTYNRVFASLPLFTVLTEHDEEKFRALTQAQPLVIVLKKNTTILRKWKDLLVASNTFKGQPLVIFDDEGDAASLNTLVNRHRVSTINRRLDEIKSTATSSLYFEVTATPQAIILQSMVSDWRPSFTNYFKPGAGYLGGNFFYSDPKSYCIRFTPEDELADIKSDDDIPCPQGLQDSIYTFLALCAHKKLNNETNCNFMIHPSSRVYIHSKFKDVIDGQLNLLQRSTEEDAFVDNLRDVWKDLQSTRPDFEPFDDIKDTVIQILDDAELMVIPLNSKSFVCRDSNDPNALDLSKGFNIVVGGNTLGRGITFPHLQVVYYCRTSKKPQADTFWQHSRVFGYDREQELVRIFIPESLHKVFVELNKANEVIVKQVENGLDTCQIIYPNNIQPTRKNVLDAQYLNIAAGGVNYFPDDPIEGNTKIIDEILAGAELVGDPAPVSKDLLLELLKHCGSHDAIDFDNKKFVSAIEALASKRPATKFKLIVRRDRDISRGTGTLLSPNDRALGDRYRHDVVLTLYRVNGSREKGWSGAPLWVPNIKLPEGYCFYDTNSIVGTAGTNNEADNSTSISPSDIDSTRPSMKTLTIKQPWASLIMTGLKDVENRSWRIGETPIRILIHCGGNIDKPALNYLEYGFSDMGAEYINAVKMGLIPEVKDLPRRAILGYATIVKCESGYKSIWSSEEPSQIQWVLEDVYEFDEPIKDVKGQLGLFSYPLDENALPSAHKVGNIAPLVHDNELVLPLSESLFKEIKKGAHLTLELTSDLRRTLDIDHPSSAKSIKALTVQHDNETKRFLLDDVFIIKARDKNLSPVNELSKLLYYEIVFVIGSPK